jgi:hypothetical protein
MAADTNLIYMKEICKKDNIVVQFWTPYNGIGFKFGGKVLVPGKYVCQYSHAWD